MRNFSDFLNQSADRHGEKTFAQIRDGDGWRTLSFRQLRDSAAALASGLRDLGMRSGDRVAILSENRPEWGIAFFGILRMDGIVVPLDKLLKKTEMESILERAKPKLIITSRSYVESVSGIFNHPPIVCFDPLDGSGTASPYEDSHLTTLANLIDRGLEARSLEKSEVEADSVAVIIFTSGTTGNAKGVMLTHGNFLSNVQSFSRMFPGGFFRANFLSALPLNHAYELTGGFLTPLSGGGTITYLDSLKPARIVETMRESKAEIMLTVPALLEMLQHSLLQQIRRSKKDMDRFNFAFQVSSVLPWRELRRWLFRDVHSVFGGKLRYFVSGGAPLSPEAQDFFERLGFEVLQGYGLTETAPVLAVNPLHRARKNSVGKPLPGIEIKINGEGGGEILIKGPNVMKGYYENTQATREVLQDGYFSTGDLGYFDPDGFLFISGRVKNLIVSSAGKKVSPEEIEEKLRYIPYTKEICVLGRKTGLEESVVAVVVPDRDKLKADGVPAGEVRAKIWDAIKKVNAAIADFKRVSDLILWDEELPKTILLKVKRRELERLIEERKKASTSLGSPAARE